MDPSEHGRRLFPAHLGVGADGMMHPDHPPERPHTLEEYAVDHFRPPPKRTMSKSLTISRYVTYSRVGSRVGNFTKKVPVAFSLALVV